MANFDIGCDQTAEAVKRNLVQWRAETQHKTGRNGPVDAQERKIMEIQLWRALR
jgi:hypothetical protein